MNIAMGPGERVIKDWVYGTVKEGRTKKNAELVVTNKRIITYSQSKIALDIEEIPLSSVNTITYHKGGASFFAKLLGVLEIIIGIPFSVLIVGIKWIMDGVRRIRSGEFSLEITMHEKAITGIYLGLRRGRSKKAKKVKVWINKTAIDDIGAQLGAIVLANQTI